MPIRTYAHRRIGCIGRGAEEAEDANAYIPHPQSLGPVRGAIYFGRREIINNERKLAPENTQNAAQTKIQFANKSENKKKIRKTNMRYQMK